MRRLFTPVLFSVLLLAGLIGCDGGSSPTTPGTPVPEGVDLNAEYGGLTFEDEMPAFGEPSLFADELLAEDAIYEDVYSEDPEVSRLRNRDGARVLMLRINWGRLLRPGPADSAGCRDQEIAYNWDGSLTIDRGAIVLKRTIQFEMGDYIHERDDRRSLEWSSTTGPHYDGILVTIIDPPHGGRPDSTGNGDRYGNGDGDCDGTGNGVADPGPNHVTFRTPLYSRTFTVDELMRMSEVIPVNRCGIAVSFTGFLERVRPCPQGFLAGIWKPAPPDSTTEPPVPPDTLFIVAADAADDGREIRGHFYGNWIQANGMLAGHLKGVYGINSDGRRVFFGKYIDLSGRFMGILRGTYGSMSMAPSSDTAGWFEGEWVSRSRTVHGYLKGHWVAAPSQPRGMFHGRWKTYCPDAPPDPEVVS